MLLQKIQWWETSQGCSRVLLNNVPWKLIKRPYCVLQFSNSFDNDYSPNTAWYPILVKKTQRRELKTLFVEINWRNKVMQPNIFRFFFRSENENESGRCIKFFFLKREVKPISPFKIQATFTDCWEKESLRSSWNSWHCSIKKTKQDILNTQIKNYPINIAKKLRNELYHASSLNNLTKRFWKNIRSQFFCIVQFTSESHQKLSKNSCLEGVTTCITILLQPISAIIYLKI